MTDQELIDFWASVDVGGREIQRMFVLILGGANKDDFHLTLDESKAWDVIAQDIQNNPPPDGSIYEIPSFN